MTTAFTAIPMKMTMSANRFRDNDMPGSYSNCGGRLLIRINATGLILAEGLDD
ncbi:MAG: hypothetical protein GKS00_26125 [Alphaproteobacteria bacterium]|nr:hypothetical protein [Alphaproteobacteria bacterium]